MALVGFDDFLLADLLDPAVTVIAQDPGQMGTVAAQTLFERLEGNVAPTRRHLVPTELVERGSGEIAACVNSRTARVAPAPRGDGERVRRYCVGAADAAGVGGVQLGGGATSCLSGPGVGSAVSSVNRSPTARSTDASGR